MEEIMELTQEMLNNIRKGVFDLDGALEQLRRETKNLPIASDFREVLLRYIDMALCWETVDDLKSIRETMVLALSMMGQDSSDLKEKVGKVMEVIDQILWCVGL
jgi:hypothetical protein